MAELRKERFHAAVLKTPVTGITKSLNSDDEPSRDNQAKFHFELRKHLPLVMVLDSGGKSLHAWFRCPDDNPNQLCKFVDYAFLSLGADPKIKQPEQLFRTPNQIRDNGNRQQVLYFDTNKTLKKGLKCKT